MAIQSKKVFIATSAFIAFIDRAHLKHAQAGAYFRYFAQEQYQLYSSSLSIAQTYEQISKDMSASVARDFLRAIILGNINILYADESDLKATQKAIISYQASGCTFTEAQNAVLADRNSISQICSFEYLHPLFGQSLFFLPI